MTMLQTPLDFSRMYTLEEFLDLDLPEANEFGEEVEYELIEGKLVARPKSGITP